MQVTIDTEKINRARVEWEVTEFEPNVGTSSETVKNFVRLRKLECNVYEFIKAARAEHPEVAEVLERNSLDEDKHLKQLNNLASHLGVTDDEPAFLKFEKQLADCKDLDITKAFVLEQIVFMLVLPEFCKEPNPNVANTATWILRDEVIHVNVNRAIVSQLIETPTVNLIVTCLQIIKYIYKNEGQETLTKAVSKARKLLKDGFGAIADNDTHVLPGSINFFEVDRNTIKY